MTHVLRATLAGAAFSLLMTSGNVASAAVAPGDDVQKILIRNGNNAGEVNRDEDGRDRPKKQVGTGQEQVQIAQLASGELLMFGMGSYEINGTPVNHRIQGLCTSVRMDAYQGPVISTMKYVSDNDGDRYRNFHHPTVVPIFNSSAMLVTFNYAPNNHAYEYQQVFGPGCEPLSEPVRVMEKNNDNCSENAEPPLIASSTDTQVRLVKMAGCNGNGEDDAWILGTSVTKNIDGSYTVAKEYDFSIEDDEERSRGIVLSTGVPDFAVACWTAGNTQPPNKGVRCGGINTAEGVPAGDRLLWRQYVAQRDGDTYRTMIRISNQLDAAGNPTPLLAATYQEALGRRRNGDDKGNHALMATMLQASPAGLSLMSVPTTGVFPQGDATHGTMCSSMWGTAGAEYPVTVLLSSSFNGSPGANATLKVLQWNETTRSFDDVRRVGLNAAIDNQWISNIYGENPTNQGRNYVQCLGNIQNPGYGIEGGYMPDVKSFIAVPATTRRMDPERGIAEDKLATELVLVPAVVAPETPDDPSNPGDGDDVGDGNGDGTGNGGAGFASSGGCSAGGNGAGLGGLILIGLAMVLWRRKR